MYIQEVEIKNIRSIGHFKMTFAKPAGWHVLIGDNGSGKSSVVRAVALGMIGEQDAQALFLLEDFAKWLPPHIEKGEIKISILRDNDYDKPEYKGKDVVTSNLAIIRIKGNGNVNITGSIKPKNGLWGDNSGKGWYISAYGPVRRLRGGNDTFAHMVNSRPRVLACLSAFRDDIALTQVTAWLKDLALDAPKKATAKAILDGLIGFINAAKLLPDGAILLTDIDSDGLKLKDANGVNISLFEMSDGYRSILSMTLDIIRLLLDTYGDKAVFPTKNQTIINLPGVVIIDEVDAHLHPTWQTRIGQWFTQYFPNIQFIVTTHSPLVCRACDNGSIWQLAAPGSGVESQEIVGVDKDRLIYGNVLDAYGTELFGANASQSEAAQKMIKELADLNVKSFKGIITPDEKLHLNELRAILPTTS